MNFIVQVITVLMNKKKLTGSPFPPAGPGNPLTPGNPAGPGNPG